MLGYLLRCVDGEIQVLERVWGRSCVVCLFV